MSQFTVPQPEEGNPWVEVETASTRKSKQASSIDSQPQHSNTVPSFTESSNEISPQLLKQPSKFTQKKMKSNEAPRTPSKKVSYIHGMAKDLIFGVCLVNFHHLRGPEVEYSFPPSVATDAVKTWPYLPFQALPDGAHSFEETFSYFTLKYFDQKENRSITLFAISCARQIRSSDLLQKDDDVTRSSVQKSIVVILKQPIFGQIKEKLSIVTRAFFDQKNFNDKTIVDALYQSLRAIYSDDSCSVDESDFYSGLSVRDILRDLKKDVLVILKAMLLEKKVAFYSSNPTKLCLTEFAFISLIPNLINNLLDSSSPELDQYAEELKITTSFKTSDRNSVLDFAGLPLQIFGKGGIFSPYSPLQQFEDLKNTEYYVIGTSNALLLNHKAKLADILINLDTGMVEILNPALAPALVLTSADKKWMSQLIHATTISNSESYSGFLGNDDYIRWQFEDYFTGLLATVKYDDFLRRSSTPQESRDYDGNQLKHFNHNFITLWKTTHNYKLFNEKTDDHIFDVFEPKHVYVNENKSLSEKLQQFKLDNSKKFEEYKKGFLNRDNLKENLRLNTTDVENPQESSGTIDSAKKSHPPGKIWTWYTSKKKEKE